MNRSWIPVMHYLRDVEWLYSESRMVHLWLEILFRVHRAKGTYPIKGTTIDILPGQFVASTRKLAASIGADKDTVGRYMRIFEAQKWIRRLEIGNATLYTVLVMDQIPGFSIMAPSDTTAIGASSEAQSPQMGTLLPTLLGTPLGTYII